MFGMSTIAYTNKDGDSIIPISDKMKQLNKAIGGKEIQLRTMPIFEPLLDW